MQSDVDKVHIWESFRALAAGCADAGGDSELAKRFGVGSRWMKHNAIARADRDKVKDVQANLSAALAWGMRQRKSALDHPCFKAARRLFFEANFQAAGPQAELFDGFKATS